MNRRRTINALTGEGLDEAIREVKERRLWIERKTKELCERLAEYGAKIAKIMFRTARYDGDNDVSVIVEERGGNAYAVVATGDATLFIEFGSGIMLGRGHPEAKEVTPEMGPGTWSDGPRGKGHWKDPRGWWTPEGKHSFGNPPAGAMYSGRKEIEQEFARIAREVFGVD